MPRACPPGWLEPDAILERFHREQEQQRQRAWARQQAERDLPREIATLRQRLDRLEGCSPAGRRDMIVRRELPLLIKSVNTELREIEGVATAGSVDHTGDEVVPSGAVYSLPLPLLLFHQSDQPVGSVHEAKVGVDGIKVRARIAEVPEPGAVKELVDRAWHLVKNRLLSGLSIGFRPLEHEATRTGFRYRRSQWHELSLVSIPAHPGARIEVARGLL